MTRRLSALEPVEVTVDNGSFVRWDTKPVTVAADEAYAAERDQARELTGLDEAVVTGEGMIAEGEWARYRGEPGCRRGPPPSFRWSPPANVVGP